MRTAVADNPRLSVRLVDGPNPARVVIDPRGRLPDGAALLDGGDGVRRVLIQACDRPRARGIEVVRLPAVDGWIAPTDIHAALTDLGFARALIEGGGITIAGFLEAGLLQRLHVAISPLIIGAGPSGLRTTTPVACLADALRPETCVYGLDFGRGLRLRAGGWEGQQVDVADDAAPRGAPRLKPVRRSRKAGLRRGLARRLPPGRQRAPRPVRQGATGSRRCAPRSRAAASTRREVRSGGGAESGPEPLVAAPGAH